MKKPIIYLAALATIFGAGCHSLRKGDTIERDWLGREIEIEYTVPSKIVAIWTNSVFNETGQSAVRGLGGRVYFYDAEHKPVRVDGKLSIFLYDDTDATHTLQQEATKVVHFSPENVASNLTPSEFGASYSFWVPWDGVGGDRKQLSVIPVFTDATGQMVVGDQARHLLPGSEPVGLASENGSRVTQVNFTTKTNVVRRDVSDSESRPLPMSTKIALPRSMQERLKRPPPVRPSRSWRSRGRSSTDQATTAKPKEPNSRVVQPDTDEAQISDDATDSLWSSSDYSQLRPPQAPSSPFAQPVADRGRSPLGPGELLFAR